METTTIVYCGMVDNETEANLIVNQLRELCVTIPDSKTKIHLKFEFETHQLLL